MNNLVRQVGRLLPRRLRNHLKTPLWSLHMWRLSRRPDVVFSPSRDWSFRCPPAAVTGAFNAQTDDPPQVAEFAEFMALTRGLKDPLFFDLGCHFGIFSFAVLDRCGPQARAVAVDPSDTACAMVRRIAARNGWTDRLTVLQAAVGDRPGELEMVDAGVAASGYFVLPKGQPQRDRVRVPQRTIDDLAAEAGRLPDLVKIDVESFEQEVIRGGQKTLAQADIPLCLEIHNRFLEERGLDPRQLLADLADLGFRHFTCAQRPIAVAELGEPDIIRVVARKHPGAPA